MTSMWEFDLANVSCLLPQWQRRGHFLLLPKCDQNYHNQGVGILAQWQILQLELQKISAGVIAQTYFSWDLLMVLRDNIPFSNKNVKLWNFIWIHNVGIASTLLFRSSLRIAELVVSLDNKISRPASFQIGPVVNGGGQKTVKPSMLKVFVRSCNISVLVNTAIEILCCRRWFCTWSIPPYDFKLHTVESKPNCPFSSLWCKMRSF